MGLPRRLYLLKHSCCFDSFLYGFDHLSWMVWQLLALWCQTDRLRIGVTWYNLVPMPSKKPTLLPQNDSSVWERSLVCFLLLYSILTSYFTQHTWIHYAIPQISEVLPRPGPSAAFSPQSHLLWTEGKVRSVLCPRQRVSLLVSRLLWKC